MSQLHESLAEWQKYPQFVLCNGKVPCDVSLNNIDPHNPANWMSYDNAFNLAEMLGLGVGFVFTGTDPFWFLDIDHCLVNDEYTPVAVQLMNAFPGAAIEISSSGDGLHLFGCGEVPEHAKKNKGYGIEFYNTGRFVLLTGNGASGNVFIDWTDNIKWLVDTYFPPKVATVGLDWRTTPVAEWNGPEDDQVLIAKMLSSGGSAAQKLGHKASFADLWNRNVDALARHYAAVGDGSCPYDESAVDMALASHLAFWTGKDHARILRLMWLSGLTRDKWTKHKSYLSGTITEAVNGCRNVYDVNNTKPAPTPQQTPAAPISNTSQVPDNTPVNSTLTPVMRVGVQFMSGHQQVDYFKDCVYLVRNHGVLVPNGSILKPDQFKAAYAGYTFSMDGNNEKTTKSAWEAFIDNQAVKFPRVDGVCFRPNLPPQTIINDEGFSLINTFTPVQKKRIKGDVTLFINHMRNLFPLNEDYQVIMAYVAAVVQYMGNKFQWCPIVQGAEGNGKTVIMRCIENAVGSRYCHYPNASDLGGNGFKYNGWIEAKVAIAIEEIYVTDRRELTEPLKPLITNDRIEIQHKGLNQYTGDNFANFIMFSNHKDCMKMSYDGRRYWMHFCPHQTEYDLQQAGMGSVYFNALYDWLKYADGYAMVADYLWTYDIPDALNPATTCQRAPKSTSLAEAVVTSMGAVEQHIQDAIESERSGFKGGYISSKCLADLLKEIGKDKYLTLHKRKEILLGLGYHKHPRLNNGRVNNNINAEGTKSVLYINRRELGDMQDAQAIKTHYEQAQGYLPQGKLQVV